MDDILLYQIRIQFDPGFASLVRNDPSNALFDGLNVVLDRHCARMKCQLDAFLDYVHEAESVGTENYPLYEWALATVQDPVKQLKYSQSFTLYVAGDEVYSKARADALERELLALSSDSLPMRVSKYDTDVAHNPQPPAKNS